MMHLFQSEHHRRRVDDSKRLAFIVRTFGIVAVCITLVGCSRSALPPDHALMSKSDAALRAIVLSNAPIGMSQVDVEAVLTKSFRRKWRVVNYESRELVSRHGFSVPVSGGDYYLTTDLSVVRRDVFSSDVVTVYFLFGSSRQLKDISVKKWTDSI